VHEIVGALGQLPAGIPAEAQGGGLYALGSPVTHVVKRQALRSLRARHFKRGPAITGECGSRPTLGSRRRRSGLRKPADGRGDRKGGRANGKITDEIASLHCLIETSRQAGRPRKGKILNKFMSAPATPLAAATDPGSLGVFQVKRLWSRHMAARQARAAGAPGESYRDMLVIHALGLGLEPTLQFLYRKGPSFEEFERWIVATAGAPDPVQAARINAAIAGTEAPEESRRLQAAVDSAPPVLSPADMAFWEEHGYVIVHDAVTAEMCAATERVIWEHLGMRPDEPGTWYSERTQGIMVQLFRHAALDANRRSPRIHKAFAQLWGTSDLWVTTDRVGFNPPERPGWKFPGPDLHWDVSLYPPMPFGTQGILYLTDTPAEQGAFTCVPGFHRRLAAWLQSLPPGTDPRREDIHALGSKPIAGRAGDLIIWHQGLPHGSRPNRGTRPRLVHYINMYTAHLEEQPTWR